VLRLNKSRVLVFLLLFSFLFGQRFESRKSDKYTFKDAVNRYSRKEYVQTKNILNNLSFSEEMQYEEEIELLLMKTEYRLYDFEESSQIGKNFLKKYPNSNYTADIYMVFGDLFSTDNKHDSAFRTYLKSLRISTNKKLNDKLYKRVFKTLQFGISFLTIEELLSTEVNNNVVQLLLLSKAHIELSEGLTNQFNETISKLDKQDLPNRMEKYLNELIESSKSTLLNINVPVILPLSGKDSKIGLDYLDGLKFAQVNKNDKSSNISFIVYDNESDQLKTIEILEKINNNKKQSIILGPIKESNAIVAGSYSNQIDIPIILPFTVNDDLAKISQNLFFLNSDLESRAETAARTVVEDLSAENIAILAPADKNGRRIVDAFSNELNRYELTPLVTEWYSGIPMNLSRQFESIRDKAWELQSLSDTTSSDSVFFDDPTVLLDSTLLSDSTFSSRSIIDSLLAIFKAEEELMTKDDSADVVLETIDAIYMPINTNDLEYVGAQFPAYNLETKVIGNDNWTNMNILQNENIGPHLDSMLVITNYKLHSINQLNTMIDQKRTKNFYQAIDSYNMILDLVNKSYDWDKSIKQLLSSSYYYSGIFGSYNFSNGRNVNSNLNIIEFDGRRFKAYEKDNQLIN